MTRVDDDDAQEVAAASQPSDAASQASLPLGAVLKGGLGRGHGARIGRYMVLRLLGEGGMGTVFAAYDEELDRKVAIKLLRTDARGAPLDRGWLMVEAKAMARISHPNVVQIYDVGEAEGQVFVAMELIQGVTVRDWLRAAPRSWREILAVFVEAGRGLAAVHDADLVHRDFKPHNVLVGADGRARIVDFGLAAHPSSVGPSSGSARLHDSHVSKTTLGTPAYMSPEQHGGGETDARSDQFAFSVALFEALFGERPFAGATGKEIFDAITRGEIRPFPRESRVPQRIRRALLRGLAVDPAARWPAMSPLLDALAEDRGAIWRRRALVLGVLALALALAGSLARQRDLEAESEAAACGGGEARIAAIWGDPQRQAVRARFAATDLVYAEDTARRVVGVLDRYGESWAAVDRELCLERRRGRLAVALHERGETCLDDHRQALAALVQVLVDADADVVERAIRGALSLPRVERCGDQDRLAREIPTPEDPAIAAEIAAHRRRIAELRAAITTGRPRGCADEAAALVDAVEPLAQPRLSAEAHFAAALCADVLGEYEAAEEAVLKAIFAAEAGAPGSLAIEIGIRLVYVIGYRRGRHEEAATWGRLVRSWVRRGGDRDDELGRLEGMLGVLDLLRGRPEEAVNQLQGALTRIERVFGHEHTETVAILNNLGAAYNALARFDDLEATITEALRIHGVLLGPAHPERATLLSNLGNVRLRRGDLTGAILAHHEAFALREQTLGPDHPDLAVYLNNLSAARARQHDYPEAISLLERALTIRERALGPDHPSVANLLANLAGDHIELGEPERAIPLLERALTLRRAAQADHPFVATILTLLARARLARGELAAAAAAIDEAAALREASQGNVDERGDTRYVQAEILWARSPGPAGAAARLRARALAQASIDDYTEAGPLYRDEIERASAWLAAHPAP
ncbi:MAG: serine/threonine-protein kinase [Nannocystaceae bacterium]